MELCGNFGGLLFAFGVFLMDILLTGDEGGDMEKFGQLTCSRRIRSGKASLRLEMRINYFIGKVNENSKRLPERTQLLTIWYCR